MASIWASVAKTKWVLLTLAVLYAAAITLGWTMASVEGGWVTRIREVQEAREAHAAEAVEKVFGRFRESVREGKIGTIALCAAIIFSINLLGSVANFALPGILVVPLVGTLLLGGWSIGLGLGGTQASSSLSLLLFYAMAGMEWATYVVASAAGANIGLSLMFPKRQGTNSRAGAFRLALADAGRLYVVIACILIVQAVTEILYVRKILLMGGTGVPLGPY